MNYYAPRSNHLPQPYHPSPPPNQGGSRTVLIIVLGLVGVGVLVFGVVAVLLARIVDDRNPFSLTTEALVQPEVGQCAVAQHQETIVEWSAVVADCSVPAATLKIVASEIVTGRNVEVECSIPDKLMITEGRVDGDYTVAHSCAAPNLAVGECYSGGIGGYTHVPGCSGVGTGQLARILPQVTDVGVCESDSSEIAVKFAYISIHSMHFIDRRSGSTYCFAPVPA